MDNRFEFVKIEPPWEEDGEGWKANSSLQSLPEVSHIKCETDLGFPYNVPEGAGSVESGGQDFSCEVPVVKSEICIEEMEPEIEGSGSSCEDGSNFCEERPSVQSEETSVDGQQNVCHICNKTFHFQKNLHEHLLCHNTVKPFGCELCLMTFDLKQDLARHRQLHNTAMPFKCYRCDRTFSQRHYLLKHFPVHFEPPAHTCPECGKSFSGRDNLRVHRLTHKDEDDKKFVCVHCNKRFWKKSELDYHVPVHTRNKMFECNFCRRNYKYEASLQYHVTTSHPSQTLVDNNEPQV